MSRPTRWAFSPLDYAAHLLLCDGDHPSGVLKERCGHLLPVAATVHDHPTGRTCPHCALAFLVDSDAPGRSRVTRLELRKRREHMKKHAPCWGCRVDALIEHPQPDARAVKGL